MKHLMVIDPKDNVGVVSEDVAANETLQCFLEGESRFVKTRDSIPIYHKVAIKKIRIGEYVIKYGQPIGKASMEIEAGDHVHTQNVEHF